MNEDTNCYDVSAFLIAQLGKNDCIKSDIKGSQIIDMSIEVLSQVQHQVGGGIVFLECENKDKLLNFYNQNNFQIYGERFSKSENTTYKQLLRFF